jgi:DNA-binding SARP family transcriptional activator/ABC-type branched-subunit amino acid transport system substrate-binding protein
LVIEYRVLGPIEVTRDGRPISVGAGKQRALLAALLVERNTAVPADRLIDRLWGERPPATVAKNLQVVVSQLRKAIGEEQIRTVGGGYMLSVEPESTDEERFEGLLAEGREQLAAANAPDAERTLGRALALFRGRPYEDVAYEDFAREEIARLEERRLAAMEEWFDALLESRRTADAAAGLERFVSDHPYRERAIGQLMLALHRSGRRAEALAAFDAARRRLAEELGIEPGDRLQRLHAAMLDSAEEDGGPLDDISRPPQPAGNRRAWALVGAGGALLAAAAVAAAIVLRSGGTEATLTSVSGDHVAAINAAGLTIDGQYEVGATPTSVAGAADTAYTLNADGQTVSRVQLETGGQSLERGVPSPSDIALGAGALWVSSIDRRGRSFTASVLELDLDTLAVRRKVALPGVSSSQFTLVPLTFGAGALYATAPSGKIVRLDPETLELTEGAAVQAEALAATEGAVWAVTQGIRIVELDPTTLERRRSFELPAKTGIEELAAGVGAIWGAEAASGLLWRIHPGPPLSARSISVGLSASDVAVGAGAVWVASGIDGAVLRVDPVTEKVRRVSTGNAPQQIAVVGDRVLVTVAGARSDLVATRTTTSPGIPTLPATACRPVVYGGEGRPDLLIASDLSFQGDLAQENWAVVQAIEYTLRQHRFRAGDHRVGYQSCDDTTVSSGFADAGKCEANAHAYVATLSVLAVIGSFYSGCAELMLPIMNAAKPSPLALVSPANSYTGLTMEAPGNTEGHPESLYRNGPRNFFRVYPADILQGDSDAELARRLGVKRPFVHLADPREQYQIVLADEFVKAARLRALAPVGPSTEGPGPDAFRTLVQRLRRQGVDGAFISAYVDSRGTQALVRALRKEFGPTFPIIMPDSGLLGLHEFLGPLADGIYVSAAAINDPFDQLPPNGQRFVREFSATQPRRDVNSFAPYAAQATEVVLAAIARSDGTRGSVLEELRRTQVKDGILGSFRFDRNGDMTLNLIPVFRMTSSPGIPDRPFTIIPLQGAGPT